MTAQKKIEKLTDSWYGYVLFSSVLGFVANTFQNGLGIFGLLWAGACLAFSLVVTYIIGRNLQRKGQITRLICLVVSAISAVTGSFGVYSLGTQFLASWSFSLLFQIVIVVTGLMMAVRSFRTLTDSQVKSFIKS